MNTAWRLFGLGIATLALGAGLASAQVYSPKLLKSGQADTSSLASLAQTIFHDSHAVTDREKAEAIWRYYLTDGRFVKPGIFYHIPGWAYEEPMGEVLDPIKLLNSYGFGLCYQDAPLLQATWEAGGFPHARVWFLTGHTVAEVFYDGQYHYYDSDLMGYTTVGNGSPKTEPVASVQQIASDKSILLDKLESPRKADPAKVDYPWYNADVGAGDIDGIEKLFATTDDNYVYGYTRFPHGHTMDFMLRLGEKMVRYYHAPNPGDRYMPYKLVDGVWKEFPNDTGKVLLVKSGPRSEKDYRRWSVGLLDYVPPPDAQQQASELAGVNGSAIYAVTSPYVIIDAQFALQADLQKSQSLSVETSTDDGHTWTPAATLQGLHTGEWTAQPGQLATTAHGTLNAIAGSYGYLVRFHLQSESSAELAHAISAVHLSTTFQLNPRTLPQLTPGSNFLHYTSSDVQRTELPIHASDATAFALKTRNAAYEDDQGQGFLKNASGHTGELVFRLTPQAAHLEGVDAGGRFLDLGTGLAPNKLTAEVRSVTPWPADKSAPRSASIAWSTSPAGPWKTLWTYNPTIHWPDHHTTPQILRWPEIDRNVRNLAAGTKAVYIRYTFRNMALDSIRLATIEHPTQKPSELIVEHTWKQDGVEKSFEKNLPGGSPATYQIDIPAGATIDDEALVFSAR
jgi:hypothetical protein